jgi:hypothetical protein
MASSTGTIGLKHPEKVLQANGCLAENALERGGNEVSMHRNGDAPGPSNHPDMRATLSGDREAEPR